MEERARDTQEMPATASPIGGDAGYVTFPIPGSDLRLESLPEFTITEACPAL